MSAASVREPYPSDVSDEEWSLVVGYLTLMKEDAPQREYPLRELFNALRYVIRYGIAWRAMPKGSSSRWSSCPRPSEASFSCLDVGWWRGPLPGHALPQARQGL